MKNLFLIELRLAQEQFHSDYEYFAVKYSIEDLTPEISFEV